MRRHSETVKSPDQPTLKKGRLTLIGQTALVIGVAYGAGIGTFAAISKPGSTTTVTAAEGINDSVTEQEAYAGAVSYANDLETVFNSNGNTANIRIFNGVFEQKYKNGKYVPVIKDPIILSQFNPNAAPDKDGKFLNGGWIGMVETATNGSVLITPIPVDGDNNRFVAYDPREVIFPNLGVYATSVNNAVGVVSGHELFAYDLQGKKGVHNSDGSPISPGEELVDK